MNIWKEFEKYSNIQIIDFNLEEILYQQVKLFKFENLLKSLKEQKEEETPEGDGIFDPKYMEDFDYISSDISIGWWGNCFVAEWSAWWGREWHQSRTISRFRK